MNSNSGRPVALVILDGWGISPRRDANAIAMAHKPNFDAACKQFAYTTLAASGPAVGLRPNESGNAEIGHLTMGAGRVVRTQAATVADAISSGDFMRNEVLSTAFSAARERNAPVHLIGLLSDGMINSSQETLFALLRMAKGAGFKDVFVHGILDGVDVQPRTADIYVEATEIKMADIGVGQIASLCGRHYAMDAGQNWERTVRAYTMLVHGEGERSFDAVSAIRASFLRGISDEFISPIVIEKRMDVPLATIQNGDLVIFFNHNPEPIRQLVRSLSVPDNGAAKPQIDTICLVEYDAGFGLTAAFESKMEPNVLGSLTESAGFTNYRISESTRIRHISDYFDGDSKGSSAKTQEIIIPSPSRVELESGPESRSFKIVDSFIKCIESSRSGFFVVNLPAADMVAETSSLDRTVESVQYIDTCLGGIIDAVKKTNAIAVITSSHGRCEDLTAESDGRAFPKQTENEVPFLYIDPLSPNVGLIAGGTLQDVAPTILGGIGLAIPPEMTGRDLRIV